MFEGKFSEDEIDAALLNADVESLVTGGGWYQTKGWNNIYSAGEGDTFDLPRLGIVEILKNTYSNKDYDEMPQGGEDFVIVLRSRGDDRFFIKRGHKDSYGGVEWQAGMERTEGTLKTVTVFE